MNKKSRKIFSKGVERHGILLQVMSRILPRTECGEFTIREKKHSIRKALVITFDIENLRKKHLICHSLGSLCQLASVIIILINTKNAGHKRPLQCGSSRTTNCCYWVGKDGHPLNSTREGREGDRFQLKKKTFEY